MSREDLIAGLRAMAPLSVGIVPFALITGITAVSAGITPLQAVGMSIVRFRRCLTARGYRTARVRMRR
jgi:AzlC protein.